MLLQVVMSHARFPKHGMHPQDHLQGGPGKCDAPDQVAGCQRGARHRRQPGAAALQLLGLPPQRLKAALHRRQLRLKRCQQRAHMLLHRGLHGGPPHHALECLHTCALRL